ncbi:metal-dependent hydrolase [Cocleimonas flava]|uniref:LexA-binding, inner membrane-associated putative hydrolase n=1 Tax=Cocleimonas flava TaxID=634765 RepID=A0A4R1F607_9GAMM|nr:metal-dependent hydrolase [Cocleimonas flava]TCJ88930.1 LexA-binding, inner membrane-associated putative hydrolase [Cocleimonas flava]
MANFNTHLGVAAVGSGMLATLCLQVGLVDAKDAILLASMGVVGGILPDIDLHYSYPSRILFSLLGIVAAFLWVFAAENDLPIIYLWGAGLGVYLIVRYPIWSVFQKMTVHRGAIHSIGVAILFAFATAAISYHFFARPAFISWLVAFFIFSGFILHLLLDEIYSVDFMGQRLKRSFGTALKLIDYKDKTSSAVIILGIVGLWFVTPDTRIFIDTITSPETYRVISERLL